MKKGIFIIICLFVLSNNIFAKPSYTWKMVAQEGCYAMYSCIVITKNPICTYGSSTGWECICAPWNCYSSN